MTGQAQKSETYSKKTKSDKKKGFQSCLKAALLED